MFSRRKCIAALTFLSTIYLSSAQECATVLPPGVHRSRFINVFVDPVTNTFNEDGKIQSIAAPLNTSIPAAKVANSNPQFRQLYNALNALEPGLGDGLLNVNLHTQAEVKNHLTYFTLERGLSNRLSGGVMVPYIQQKVKASFHADVEGGANRAALEKYTNNLMNKQLKDYYSQALNSTNFESALFTQRGYKVPSDFNTDMLGDVELGLKYQFVKSEHDLLSVVLGARLPTTSHRTDYTNILDQGVPGITDNQFDMGMQIVNDFMPNDQFTFGSALMLTTQLPSTSNRPVPRRDEEALPDLNNRDNWDDVKRDLGDLVETELSATYTFHKRYWSAMAMHQFKYKASDRYSGGKSYLDYDKLGANTNSWSHRYALGVGFSTVNAYLRKKFVYPFDLRLSYNDVLKAKNTIDAGYTRIDLWAYF